MRGFQRQKGAGNWGKANQDRWAEIRRGVKKGAVIMKKCRMGLAAAILAASVTLTASAGYNLSEAGVISAQMGESFRGKEAVLTQRYKEAYEWATRLHAQDAKDGLFDFGSSSEEGLHTWTGWNVDGTTREIACQDFTGGNSTAAGAFLYDDWSAILCSDPDTLNVVVVRDAAADFYVLGGGINNWMSGSPVTNQYWRIESGVPVLYQQFENGYFRAEEGESWYSNFHSKVDEGKDYIQPPQAPPAYGNIYAVNEDGCSWENPKYIPTGSIVFVKEGDFSGDGLLDISDVMEMCKTLARKSAGQIPAMRELGGGDLDGDGDITISDVMEVCKRLARRG